ncbi:MAG TPA: phasin family protein [Thermoanaerobaculia bacterium]|nr:phasin family protein [Thermoanaerobaculia bacterium]
MTEPKKTPRDLPQDVLDVAHRVWLAGLGAFASAQESGDRMFRQLVDRGREMEVTRGTPFDALRGAGDRARATADELRANAESAAGGVGDALDERVGAILRRFGVPTRDEIHDLTRRVEELADKIDRLRATPATSTATAGVTASDVMTPSVTPAPKLPPTVVAKPPEAAGGIAGGPVVVGPTGGGLESGGGTAIVGGGAGTATGTPSPGGSSTFGGASGSGSGSGSATGPGGSSSGGGQRGPGESGA